MKLNFKSLFILCSTALLIGFTSSCKDKDDDNDDSTNNKSTSVAGTSWVGTGMTWTVNTGNPEYNQIIADEENVMGNPYAVLSFSQNGTYTDPMMETGNYSQDGNTIKLNPGTLTEMTFVLNGEILSFTEDRTGYVQSQIAGGWYHGVPENVVVTKASSTLTYKKK